MNVVTMLYCYVIINIKQNHTNSSDDLNMTDQDHFEKSLAHDIHVDLTAGERGSLSIIKLTEDVIQTTKIPVVVFSMINKLILRKIHT